jgi:dUTP pyrophosphatase
MHSNPEVATFTKHHLYAEAPKHHHVGDAGYDLTACEDTNLWKSGEWVRVELGIRIQPPEGIWFEITGRSSNATVGIEVARAVIDSGYRGVLFVIARSVLSGTTVRRGERIAQLIPHRLISLDWQETSLLEQSTRGEDGFGSTGR